jgi:glycine reductase complex component B subunit gamma
MTPVAEMVGSHRIVTGNGIVHPLGSAESSPEEEKKLRRRILERALDALEKPADKPTIF